MDGKKILKIFADILNYFFLGLTFFLIFISLFKKDWVEMGINWIQIKIQILGVYNYFIALISSMIEGFPVLGNLLPGQNIMLFVGGFFGKISTLHLVYVIIMASIGAILGNFIGYILGVHYGDSFFEKYGLYFGIGKTEVKYLHDGMEKWGALGIIVGKFHPITRAFLPFIAGSVKMKQAKFMLYNIIGSVIRASSIITFGVVFVHYYKFFLQYSGTIMLTILGIIATYIYFFKKEAFLRYWEEKNKEIEDNINKNQASR